MNTQTWMQLVCFACITLVNGNKTQIYIGGVFHGVFTQLEATKLAIADVNERGDLLPGYELVLVPKVMGFFRSDRGLAVKLLFDLIHEPPLKHILIAPPYSMEAEPFVETANGQWNVLTTGTSTSSPELSDRTTYPYFIRVGHSDDAVNKPTMGFLQGFGWSRIGVIYDGTSPYSSNARLMRVELEANNMTVEMKEFDANNEYTFESFKVKDIRIFIIMGWPSMARKIMCEAHRQGMTNKKYVWLFSGLHDIGMKWDQTPDGVPQTNCSLETLIAAAEETFDFGGLFNGLSNFSTVIATDKTKQEIVERMQAAGRYFRGASDVAYDSVLTIASTLSRSMTKLAEVNRSLADFSYGDQSMTDIIYQSANEVEFQGMTGSVAFTHGERHTLTQLYQVKGGKFQKVGHYTTAEGSIIWDTDAAALWNGNEPPPDRRRYVDVPVYVSSPVFIVMCVLCCLGLAAALFLLAFNILHRHDGIIKMSSPNVNNIIIFGCMVCYMSVVMFGFNGQTEFPHICLVRLWLLPFGFSLAYGGIFAKTWRVYMVLTRRVPERKVIKDYLVFALVTGIVFVDIIILSISSLVDPIHTVQVRGQLKITDDPNTLEVPIVFKCQSASVAWLPMLYCFHGLLLVFGVFLAWETRKVKVAVLNDSKNIGFCIYNVFITSAVGVGVNYIVDVSRVDEIYAVTSICIIVAITATLLIIFVPKVVAILRGKKLGKLRIAPSVTQDQTLGHDINACHGNCDEAKKLRQMLLTKHKELSDVRRQCGEDGVLMNLSSDMDTMAVIPEEIGERPGNKKQSVAVGLRVNMSSDGDSTSAIPKVELPTPFRYTF